MNSMEISSVPSILQSNSAYTNDWLQSGYFDIPLSTDQMLSYSDSFSICDSSDQMASMETSVGGEDFFQFSSPQFFDSDGDLELNLPDQQIAPTIDEVFAIPLRSHQRKRGRPRTARNDSTTSRTSYQQTNPKLSISGRVPHNQVERKYREGLNAGMERLRLMVPAVARWECGPGSNLIRKPKPSKAMVLVSAIDYIHDIKLERDRLVQENKMLRGD